MAGLWEKLSCGAGQAAPADPVGRELKQPNAGPLYSLLHLSLVVDHPSMTKAMQGGLGAVLATGAIYLPLKGNLGRASSCILS